MNVLEADHLYRFYHVDDSEVLALRGATEPAGRGNGGCGRPSGSGTSTLLNCLAGLDEPDGRYVGVLGQRLSRREAEIAKLCAAHIGILLQSNNRLPTLSVAENIRVTRRLAQREDSRFLDGLLAQVGLSERRHHRPTLRWLNSGGGLSRTEMQILRLLEARRDRGGAALILTHSPALASWADR